MPTHPPTPPPGWDHPTESGVVDVQSAGRVHHHPHDTETAAAVSVADHTGKIRTAVLGLLREHPGGLTDDEGGGLLTSRGFRAADRLTFGRRRQELALLGLVVDSGRRRPTPRGRSAIVWTAVRSTP